MHTPKICAAVLAAIAVSTPVRAQQRRLAAPSDSVPRALAELLANPAAVLGIPAADHGIYVGALPPALASVVYLPPGARILGGSGQWIFGGAIGVIDVPGSADSVDAALTRGQTGHGFTLAKSQPNTAFMWGFRPHPENGRAIPQRRSITFCATNDKSLVAQIVEQDAGVARVVFLESEGPSACGTSDDRMQMPLLVSPDTPNDAFERCSVRWSSIGSSMPLYEPAMSADAIYAHYARQLADSGWAEAANGKMAGAVWTKADSAGGRREVRLSVAPGHAPGCYEAKMDGGRVQPNR